MRTSSRPSVSRNNNFQPFNLITKSSNLQDFNRFKYSFVIYHESCIFLCNRFFDQEQPESTIFRNTLECLIATRFTEHERFSMNVVETHFYFPSCMDSKFFYFFYCILSFYGRQLKWSIWALFEYNNRDWNLKREKIYRDICFSQTLKRSSIHSYVYIFFLFKM